MEQTTTKYTEKPVMGSQLRLTLVSIDKGRNLNCVNKGKDY